MIWLALGTPACAVAVVALLCRQLEVTNPVILIGAAFSPYLLLFAPIALVLLAVGRRSGLAFVAAVVSIAGLVTQLRASHPPQHADQSAVRVMTINLFEGSADATAVVSSAKKSADIVMVQELTDYAEERLSALGMSDSFPYRIVKPRPGSTGAGLWSRYPLAEVSAGVSLVSPVAARAMIPEVGQPVSLLVVHPPAPWPPSGIDAWRNGLAGLVDALHATAQSAVDAPIVVAGDFNATPDMVQFRRLLSDGYREANRRSALGLVATYPANGRIPPLIAIDHVLTRGCVGIDSRTATIGGTDHRALLATILIERAAGSDQSGSDQ